MKKYIKIINEEINDILNDPTNLFQNNEFQLKFINNAINKLNNINFEIVEGYISNEYEEYESGKLSIDITCNVTYKYEPNKIIKFQIIFTSPNKIEYSIDTDTDKGDYYTAPYSTSRFTYFEYGDIDVNIYTDDGEEINFNSINNINGYHRSRFIRMFIRSYIENKTGISLK